MPSRRRREDSQREDRETRKRDENPSAGERGVGAVPAGFADFRASCERFQNRGAVGT